MRSVNGDDLGAVAVIDTARFDFEKMASTFTSCAVRKMMEMKATCGGSALLRNLMVRLVLLRFGCRATIQVAHGRAALTCMAVVQDSNWSSFFLSLRDSSFGHDAPGSMQTAASDRTPMQSCEIASLLTIRAVPCSSRHHSLHASFHRGAPNAPGG